MTRSSTIRAVLLGGALAMGPSTSAFARDLIVVLAGDYDRPTASSVWAALMPTLEQASPGDNLAIYDGPTRTRIMGASFPEGEEGDLIEKIPALRAKLYGPVMEGIKQHLRGAVSRHEDEQPVAPMQVSLPEMLEELGYIASAGPEIVVIGSAMQHDETAPEFSMRDAFPNDGHFALPTSASPYGTAGMGDTLGGAQVHFCSTDADDDYVKRVHRLGVERAIGLLVQGYGGQLATFTTDIRSCLNRAASGTSEGAATYRISVAGAPAMVDPSLAVPASPRLPAEQLDLLRDLRVDDADRVELEGLMQSGEVTLERVWLADDADEDGDVATILAAGVSIDVPLTKQEQEFIVPVMQGRLVVRGKIDGGGGGVTLRLRTERGDQMQSPVMQPGEVVEIAFVGT